MKWNEVVFTKQMLDFTWITKSNIFFRRRTVQARQETEVEQVAKSVQVSIHIVSDRLKTRHAGRPMIMMAIVRDPASRQSQRTATIWESSWWWSLVANPRQPQKEIEKNPDPLIGNLTKTRIGNRDRRKIDHAIGKDQGKYDKLLRIEINNILLLHVKRWQSKEMRRSRAVQVTKRKRRNVKKEIVLVRRRRNANTRRAWVKVPMSKVTTPPSKMSPVKNPQNRKKRKVVIKAMMISRPLSWRKVPSLSYNRKKKMRRCQNMLTRQIRSRPRHPLQLRWRLRDRPRPNDLQPPFVKGVIFLALKGVETWQNSLGWIASRKELTVWSTEQGIGEQVHAIKQVSL